jgi:Lamin Tail Domain
MRILETFMRWDILTLFVVLSIGISVASSGGTQNNASLNVGMNATKVSILGVNYAAADQLVKISNNGSSNISLAGWKLMNKENLSYTFPKDFILKAGASIRVHSMAGNENSTDLYNSSILWSKKGDTAILKDSMGMIASEYAYSALIEASSSVAIKNTTESNNSIPERVGYQANNTKTTVSNISTQTAKDITKVTIVK